MSDISKKIDQQFTHTEENNKQVMKRNLVNPGEQAFGEFYLVSLFYLDGLY